MIKGILGNKNRFKPSISYYLLSLMAMLFSFSAKAQMECIITADADIPLCYGQLVKLTVTEGDNYIYSWQPTGDTTSSIELKAFETNEFVVNVTDTVTGESCMSSLTVEVRPPFEISLEQMQLTCTNGDNDNGNTAMINATATGDSEPFTYRWEVSPVQIAPGNPRLAIGIKAHQWVFITIENQFSCFQQDSIYTEAYQNPVVEIEADPDTAYIQNPIINFSFTNLSADSIEITNHFWEFGDESPSSDLLTPEHLYSEEGEYSVILTVVNPQGCDTIYLKQVKVLPIKLKIPNVITPNGDNINDLFVITEAPPGEGEENGVLKSATNSNAYKPLSTYYKSTTLVIFNRHGRKVYESTNYQNDWDGGGLKDGTYFYVLKCEGFKSNEVYKGSLSIVGSSN
ncbi:MAG: gliding motility-associated C-terminal domain-containing protein [Bacteroidales bacterium]|jgi:PKD repeat protein|nr:gliding motility-associated C-terminal domain-containing protein [Bacteroidales bacterium]